jgi:hypothetical protein
MSCIVSLSKFYSSGDPLFLEDSPSPVFTAVLLGAADNYIHTNLFRQ